MTSKARFFGHFLNNSNTYQSYYGSFVLGSNLPISPIQPPCRLRRSPV